MHEHLSESRLQQETLSVYLENKHVNIASACPSDCPAWMKSLKSAVPTASFRSEVAVSSEYKFVPGSDCGIKFHPPYELESPYAQAPIQSVVLHTKTIYKVSDIVAFQHSGYGVLFGLVLRIYVTQPNMLVKVIIPRNVLIELGESHGLTDFVKVLEKAMPLFMDSCEIDLKVMIKTENILFSVTTYDVELFSSTTYKNLEHCVPDKCTRITCQFPVSRIQRDVRHLEGEAIKFEIGEVYVCFMHDLYIEFTLCASHVSSRSALLAVLIISSTQHAYTLCVRIALLYVARYHKPQMCICTEVLCLHVHMLYSKHLKLFLDVAGHLERELWPVDFRLNSHHSLSFHHDQYACKLLTEQEVVHAFCSAKEEVRGMLEAKLYRMSSAPGAAHSFTVKNISFGLLTLLLGTDACKTLHHDFDLASGTHTIAGCPDQFAEFFGNVKLATDGMRTPDGCVMYVKAFRPEVSTVGIVITYDAYFRPGKEFCV
jgi:hypothetical protein